MNSERVKIYFKRALSIVLFVVGIALIYKLLEYPLFDDTKAQTRVTFHDYYETDPIDILFVGTSHTVRALDAVTMTDELGESVFNLGTSGQNLVETEYLIRDAVENRGIRRIYCEISNSRFFRKGGVPEAIYIVTDYFKNIYYCAKLIFFNLKTDAWLGALGVRRSIEPLKFSLSGALKTMEAKKDPSYINYKGTSAYAGRGQWPVYSISYDDEGYAFNVNSNSIDKKDINNVHLNQLDHIRNIIRICRENDARLVFYIPPYSEQYMQNAPDYLDITNLAKGVVEGEDATVIDLNLVKDEYLKLNPSDFQNGDHVMIQAGKKVSSFLARYISEPDEAYFLSTIEEKHPDQDAVTAVAFSAEFITDKGSYPLVGEIKGDLKEIKLKLWAQGYHPIPVIARMWRTIYDEASDSYMEADELTGTAVDEYETEFSFETDSLETNYLIRLYDPATGRQLYQAYTKFDKD